MEVGPLWPWSWASMAGDPQKMLRKGLFLLPTSISHGDTTFMRFWWGLKFGKNATPPLSPATPSRLQVSLEA